MKLQLALLVLVSTLLAGCGGPATSPTPPPPETPIAAMDFETGEATGPAQTTEGEVAEPEETAAPTAVPESGPAQE